MTKLHLGCGLKTPEGWVNLDGSWNAWLAKYPLLRGLLKTLNLFPKSQLEIPWSPKIVVRDVRRPLPFQGSVFYAVYASHLLEHLYLEQAKRLLKECHRVLRPGGVLRAVVPDLKSLILEYVSGKPQGTLPALEPMNPADRLNTRLCFAPAEPPMGNPLYKLYTALNDSHSHRWMYDAESLIGYFKWAGFVEVGERGFRDSRIEGMEEIEEGGRVLNGEGICIEGIKSVGG